MDKEAKFWISVWSIAGGFVLLLAGLIMLYNANQDGILREMVSKGADPILAACVLKGPDRASASPICILAVKK